MAVLQNVETQPYVDQIGYPRLDSVGGNTAIGVPNGFAQRRGELLRIQACSGRRSIEMLTPMASLAAGDPPHLLHLNIAAPIPAMIRFSAKLTSPRGVLELPPTQAQWSAM
jgi:hypothetical protein